MALTINTGITVGTGITMAFLPAPTTVEVLVVAGGASGGMDTAALAGGGGAGGYRTDLSYNVSQGLVNTAISIVVGAGGTIPTASTATGNNGSDSSFGTITSTGGGAGSVLLKDGGSSGTTKIEIDVPNTAAFHSVIIPQEGVLFETSVYATLTNCYVSVFYG